MFRPYPLIIAGILLSLNSFAQIEPKAKAFLELKASKTQLQPGECAAVYLSFVVYDDNRVPIQFHELGEQLRLPICKALSPAGSSIIPNLVRNIESQVDSIKGKPASRYYVYEGAICPNAAGTIVIPPVTLKMEHLTSNRKDTTIVDYVAKGFTLTTTGNDSFDQLQKKGVPAVGTFKLTETLKNKEVNVGKTFVYEMLIEGNGYTSMLFPSSINNQKFDVNLVSSESRDSIDNNSVVAYKTLKFEVTPKPGNEGTFSMAEIFGSLKFYDLPSKSVRSLTPQRSINVTNRPGSVSKPKTLPSDSVKTFVFLLDISSSMMIEDYNPTRMEFMKNEVNALIEKGHSIEPMVFSAFAKPLSGRTESHTVNEINHEMIAETGTAISDAIIFAIQHIKTSGRNYSKTILLAGDGDDTVSRVLVDKAAEYAKANGFMIYTIGVGTKGPAAFGTDGSGKKHMVNDTFSENDFKKLATKTGGRYIYLQPTSSLAELLKDL